ncbi:hypothetical protein OEV98_07500 [Caldibacillus lycopersici]|uniref:Uncharacterized protein n=1 Tax=Perspicuibacillus lycopersici TaxID=1325689 RepID=A0AAE3ITZ1_9BACI|nr:hypothetical protein [Perspicuibacillus lycopersici]MCU9613399.1 hypothetical protein [Perspicuibacillus lycopersici]
MKIIASQPYWKVLREVDTMELVQKYIEQERHLLLYGDKIVTHHREFPLENVHDISFRAFGVGGGTLYLHTNTGLYSYQVKTSPENFINAYLSIK